MSVSINIFNIDLFVVFIFRFLGNHFMVKEMGSFFLKELFQYFFCIVEILNIEKISMSLSDNSTIVCGQPWV
jgi:hypothetical protein